MRLIHVFELIFAMLVIDDIIHRIVKIKFDKSPYGNLYERNNENDETIDVSFSPHFTFSLAASRKHLIRDSRILYNVASHWKQRIFISSCNYWEFTNRSMFINTLYILILFLTSANAYVSNVFELMFEKVNFLINSNCKTRNTLQYNTVKAKKLRIRQS